MAWESDWKIRVRPFIFPLSLILHEILIKIVSALELKNPRKILSVNSTTIYTYIHVLLIPSLQVSPIRTQIGNEDQIPI